MTVIALDGPAGAGKSSVARAVADALGWTYLDTGAMYRCVALAAGEDPEPGAVAERIAIELRPDGTVLLDGSDVTDAIRTPAVSAAASRTSADPRVRAALVAQQRALLGRGDWVAEGRDIGTVVWPQAELKVFLTATPEERARRRALQFGRSDVDAVLAEQRERDARDEQRAHAPLKPAPDAIELDTTGLYLEDIVERVIGLLGGAA